MTLFTEVEDFEVFDDFRLDPRISMPALGKTRLCPQKPMPRKGFMGFKGFQGAPLTGAFWVRHLASWDSIEFYRNSIEFYRNSTEFYRNSIELYEAELSRAGQSPAEAGRAQQRMRIITYNHV